MNILFLMGAYPSVGGVERVSTILANAFVSRGMGVSIVSFEQPCPELAEKELDKAVRFHALNKPTYSDINIKLLHEILEHEHIDYIINQWVVPYFVARLCSQAMNGTKCKMISVHHNIPNSNKRIQDVKIAIAEHRGNIIINRIKLFAVTLVSRLSLRYTISKSAKYIVLSPSFIPIAEKYVWQNNHGQMISIANPLTIAKNGKREIAKRKEIIYVGRIEYNQKCTYRIVDIWERLEKQYPEWNLRIVGDGPDRGNLQSLIDSKELKHVKIEGFQNPLPYYETSSILLLVSDYEGFPLVLVESMEYGVIPFVLDSFPAVHDVIDNDVNGKIISTPFNADNFATTLIDVIDDDSKREKMSQNSRKKASGYSLAPIVDKWIILFNELKA